MARPKNSGRYNSVLGTSDISTRLSRDRADMNSRAGRRWPFSRMLSRMRRITDPLALTVALDTILS